MRTARERFHAYGSSSYSVLLRVGFSVPFLLPKTRCALTAPFHLFPFSRTGSLFSVALSFGSPQPDVIRHPFPLKPGLSSCHLLNAPETERLAKWQAIIRPSGGVFLACKGDAREQQSVEISRTSGIYLVFWLRFFCKNRILVV